MKQFRMICFSFALLFTVCVPAAAAGFPDIPIANQYVEGQFTDVPEGSSYAEFTKAAYEYGLMYGTDDTHFSPEGNLTFAQAIALSCRLHSACSGDELTVSAQNPWYVPYVEYAIQHSIIPQNAAYDYDSTINRASFAVILNAALPDVALPEINKIEQNAIPDVLVDTDYYDAVYRLYRAGILAGNSSKGEFAPSSSITRAQAAVIVSRMADPSLRANMTLTKTADPRADTLYDLILTGITERVGARDDAVIDISSLGLSNRIDGEDRALLHQVYRDVCGDHPELYAASFSYIVYGDDASIPDGHLSGIKPCYYDFVSNEQADAELEAAIERALAQTEGVTDPVEKAHILHDYMVLNCSYNREYEAERYGDVPQYAYSAYGSLVKGNAVCQGYSLGCKLLMDRAGIECEIVFSKSMNHCWNLVKLGENWYHVDVTWEGTGNTLHKYFLLSDAAVKDELHGHSSCWYTCSGDLPPACNDTAYETVSFHQN